MEENIIELREERAEILHRIDSLIKRAESENRECTKGERIDLEDLFSEEKCIEKRIMALEPSPEINNIGEIRLNIGAGDTNLAGFIPIDLKSGVKAYPLSYGDGVVAEIRASHILEHFGWAEVKPVLAEWVRALRPGGILKIAVPDMAKIIEMQGEDSFDPMWPSYLMGGQTDDNDYHKSVWNESRLQLLMEWAGLVDIAPWTSDGLDTSCHPVSLNLLGYKPGGTRAAEAITVQLSASDIVAVISMPRLGFTDNFFCMAPLSQRGLSIIKVVGAYWGQCLERGMMDIVRSKAKYVVTLDYDTVFQPEAFDALCFLMETYPEADAIAPIQMKRDGDIPMIWDTVEGKVKEEWLVSEFKPQLCRIRHAHFGLTIFRVASLQKMAHPWFWAQPNKDGEWGEGRLDDDIYFWEKWADTGNALYLANHVPIGHIQLMATWPDENMRPIHQFMSDYHANGMPPGTRALHVSGKEDTNAATG